MLDSINLQMTLGQSKYGFRRISFIIKMVDYYTTHTDFRTTHVLVPGPVSQVAVFKRIYALPGLQCMKVKDESGKNGERAEMRVHAACVQ
jgi:hypothetical protein